MNPLSWPSYTLLAAIIYTAVNILDKHVITDTLKDPRRAALLSSLGTYAIFVSISATTAAKTLSPYSLGAITAGVAYTAGVFCYYKGLIKLEVSRFIPLLSLTPLFVLAIATPALTERFATHTYAGIALLILGSYFLSVKRLHHPLGLYKATGIGLLTALFFALRNLGMKYATLGIPNTDALFWMSIGGLISCVALYKPKRVHKGSWQVLFIGLLTGLGFMVFTTALRAGPVSLVTAFMEVQMVFVFLSATLLSVFFPRVIKERTDRKALFMKCTGILMIITGAILIT